MYDLKKYQPIEVKDLIHLGRGYDGGYVLSKSQIKNTEVLLSFGINDDWSFEMDFFSRKNVALYAYDYSISKEFYKYKIWDQFILTAAYFLLMKRSKVKEHYNKMREIKKNIRNLYDYFKSEYHRYFIPKFINTIEDEENTTFYSIFESIGTIKDMSVFIKMDIEGNEYKVLPELSPYFSKINGLAIEFHELNNGQRFIEIMKLFSDYFYVAHIHANNDGGQINNTWLPKVLEITLINKLMVPGDVELSRHSYPRAELDFPNSSEVEDICLNFERGGQGPRAPAAPDRLNPYRFPLPGRYRSYNDPRGCI
jgi:hypothetical protein